MSYQASILKPSFFLMLGDNFYEDGVVSTSDPLWALYYRDLFTEPATFVPWYLILGNHDYYGKHTQFAQIEYSMKRIDTRWNMPDYFYTKVFPIGNSDATVEVVFIDTVILAPNHENPSLTGLPAGNPDGTTSDAQLMMMQPWLVWFENTLAASKATFLIVAGHYHVYTTTDGDNAVPEMVEFVVPLLKKYGVAAYIHGHEHNAEHIYWEGIHYVTLGHGCDKQDPIDVNWRDKVAAGGLLFNKTVGSFGVMTVTPTKLSFEIIDESGDNIYGATLKTMMEI